MKRTALGIFVLGLMATGGLPAVAGEVEVLPRAEQRLGGVEGTEVPDFQRHVLPLMGKLGCNGRACHGSFQGQGGFRLSLFGYDFKADHEALLGGEKPRVDLEDPEGSLMLEKPTMGIPHKGGKRMEVDGWEYRVLVRWIKAGGKGVADDAVRFDRLEVVPDRIVFKDKGEKASLRVIAHWADGTAEDVTGLTRFRTNDESIAEIDADGVVTQIGPGDTHVVAFYDNGVAPTQVLLPVSDSIGPKYPEVPTPTQIDKLVVDKLRTLGVVPSDLASDTEFLRRVSLDMTGTLPTPSEIEQFLADTSADKRSRKIDELLTRPAYAAWWATRLSDVTVNNPRDFPERTVANEQSRQWHAWIEKRIAENVPYDQIIAGIVLATSRRSGQSYEDYAEEMSSYFRKEGAPNFADRETMPHYWTRQTLRNNDERALGFAYSFLGLRLQCAQCHKHPFDQWTQ
ncbi:MAG TPA: DUF1549 domain-containing protein, partial [Planctomycetaceae bacterium]|nr:DUF1549 domain-containing protein [Planctomycetaceae bacterium]